MFVGLFAWGGLTLLTQWIALKSRWMAKMLDGEPVMLVYRGQILEENLRRLRMRESELAELLRAQSVFHLTRWTGHPGAAGHPLRAQDRGEPAGHAG